MPTGEVWLSTKDELCLMSFAPCLKQSLAGFPPPDSEFERAFPRAGRGRSSSQTELVSLMVFCKLAREAGGKRRGRGDNDGKEGGFFFLLLFRVKLLRSLPLLGHGLLAPSSFPN